ncbi:MAG: nucleotide-binding domain containing protein [Propioniciclava sp.]|uniref:nucleotide-binding domain containing protein n=1 Tax=Propioniciclava sp. TaxID=2038686 RepID=UPI0039E3B88D
MPAATPGPDLAGARCVTVVGTAHPGAVVQAERLASATGAARVHAPIDAVLDESRRDEWAGRISEALARGDVLVTLAPLASGRPAPRRALTDALAGIVARSAVASAGGPTADLILTGGETARAVLTALGVRSLRVVAEAEPGAVVSRTDGGRLIGTRPGSFGGPDSLVRLRSALSSAHPEPDPKD